MKFKFLLLLPGFSTAVFAQDSSFQLKDYKYRTPGFQALFIQFNASGALSDAGLGNAKTDKTFSLSPSQFAYLKIISTDKRLHQSTFSFVPSYNYWSNERYAQRSTGELLLQFDWNRNDRFYKNGGWFIEAGNRLGASVLNYKQTDTVNKSRQAGQSVYDEITIGFGRGRIERVQDAQMALFILNDLAAQGLLSEPATPQKANAFAQLITSINNQRVFDFRRRRIYELTMLDSFLRSSGLVKTTDIRHFTTINDNWSLSINPSRLSGSNWYVRLKPNGSYGWGNARNSYAGREERQNSRLSIIGLSPVVGYEIYVPRNLKWQFNRGVSISYQTTRQAFRFESSGSGNPSLSEGHTTLSSWMLNGFYGIGFFPNNRTQLSATLNIDAERLHESTRLTQVLITPSLVLSTTYFLGYRTYLTGNFLGSYRYSRDKFSTTWPSPSHQWNASGSIGFSHYIF